MARGVGLRHRWQLPRTSAFRTYDRTAAIARRAVIHVTIRFDVVTVGIGVCPLCIIPLAQRDGAIVDAVRARLGPNVQGCMPVTRTPDHAYLSERTPRKLLDLSGMDVRSRWHASRRQDELHLDVLTTRLSRRPRHDVRAAVRHIETVAGVRHPRQIYTPDSA